MRKNFSFLIALIFFAITSAQAQKVTSLFNGKDLKNWDIYIGTALTGFENMKDQATPESVYSVVKKDGEQLMRISGDVNASIATKEEFENYHLKLEYKWGDTEYTSFNSGLLYHSYGAFGGGLGTWMNSIECQLLHGSNGDAYSMGTTYFEIKVKDDGEKKVYAADGKNVSFGDDQAGGEIARKQKDMEKSMGEWNIVEIYCLGSKTIHVVNGEKVMECDNTGKIIDGKILPLTKGKIQIQSEGGELFIRKIELESISKLPSNL